MLLSITRGKLRQRREQAVHDDPGGQEKRPRLRAERLLLVG